MLKPPGLVFDLFSQKIEAFEHRMYSHPLHKDKNLEDLYKQYQNKAKVRNKGKLMDSPYPSKFGDSIHTTSQASTLGFLFYQV